MYILNEAKQVGTIYHFTEENFNKNYLENLVEKYTRFADAKFFWVVETKMNNNYISEEYVEGRLNKIKNVFLQFNLINIL